MKPNNNFHMTVRDIELIEHALQGKLSRRARTVMLDPEGPYTDELNDEIKEIRELLGRIHNQKVWYRPKDGRFSPGGSTASS